MLKSLVRELLSSDVAYVDIYRSSRFAHMSVICVNFLLEFMYATLLCVV
jgi:hypothetical protein